MRNLFRGLNLFPKPLKARLPRTSLSIQPQAFQNQPEGPRKLTLREVRTRYPFPPPYMSHGQYEDIISNLRPEGWVGLFVLDRMSGRVRSMCRDWNMAVDSTLESDEEPESLQAHGAKFTPLAERAVMELKEIADAARAVCENGDIQRLRRGIDQVCAIWHECVAWEAANCTFRRGEVGDVWRCVALQGVSRGVVVPMADMWRQFVRNLPSMLEGRVMQLSAYISSDPLWSRRMNAVSGTEDLQEWNLPKLFLDKPELPNILDLCPQLSEWSVTTEEVSS